MGYSTKVRNMIKERNRISDELTNGDSYPSRVRQNLSHQHEELSKIIKRRIREEEKSPKLPPSSSLYHKPKVQRGPRKSN